ncbi:Putative isochorismatase, amidase signature domain, Isochorismatase-like superfamily [Septoria linicola]|uniref:Isochorismatase, amidase signature domain, Isochorismatase-like superfamily n=1 Tax=Septoria linicola TaxID=215465 RepID=A0A9Q9AJ72_9PEZI|nr:putative isochorismatase, amidase signature domain, Isochorismatase-like superfamily [Septoria linicola]USW50317.1 Putative isochorismatase, amidase signature domain, Isochorismatase-like superfamily [Septoria linicola]
MELSSARPYAYKFRPESTALIIIDMQRDFVDYNGFGQIQCGNDEVFKKVRNIVPKTKQALEAARQLGLHVIHTREGHKPDLSDLPPSKKLRQISAPSGHHTMGIGDEGPMGRLLVRGEYGHDIIDELKPIPGEPVIDKPGKGSMWDTNLHRTLLARGITNLLFAGVTTECCVNTTARECADRGFETCILADCTDGFDAGFYRSTLDMLCSYDGLFGFVGSSVELLKYAPPQAQTPPSTPPGFSGDISIDGLRKQYIAGQLRPTDVVKEINKRISDYQIKDPAVWVHLQDPAQLAKNAQALEDRFAGKPLPELYGIPFAVKCNIDVANINTTAVCEAYTYMPKESAKVVDALLEAGALFVGKTNLDQLATGLSGCRSPYGAPRSVFSNRHISGGSSSGSSVAVGAGLVSFALGTDTAGSGRVPAAYNGIIGHKPTKGTLSAKGLVPACKSLDTITVLAPTVNEARRVWLVADQSTDENDPFAKPASSLALWHADFRGVKAGGFTFGIPPDAALQHCIPIYQKLFTQSVERLKRAGGTPLEIDWKPFEGGSNLLYDASLVQERIACIGPEFIEENIKSLHPATQALLAAAMRKEVKPWEVFRDLHLQAQYTREAADIFKKIDVLLVPTTTCHPTVAEMEADPLALNAKLGYFTHFANVLDLCGIAVPAAEYQDDTGTTLPFGVTLLGASGRDGRVYDIAREFERTK